MSRTKVDVNLRGKGYSNGAYCDDFSGTSAATPLAAGIATLTLSANRSFTWKGRAPDSGLDR